MKYATKKAPEGINRSTPMPFFSRQSAHTAAVQTKLTVNAPGDPYEQEADAVADKVMRMPTPSVSADKMQLKPIENSIQRQKSQVEPYIKKITVHLTPKQSADLEWAGTPPANALGADHFTVSTGKGYSDPGDPVGTCSRTCCENAETQCDAPFNQPNKVGACCTYVGTKFYTGKAEARPNGWHWWTPIEPYYSKRSIALHQHTEVTGEPIGHGCVRMDEENAKRIYDFSVNGKTKVEILRRWREHLKL